MRTVKCPKCGVRIRVKPEDYRRVIHCAGCSAAFVPLHADPRPLKTWGPGVVFGIIVVCGGLLAFTAEEPNAGCLLVILGTIIYFGSQLCVRLDRIERLIDRNAKNE